MKKFISTERQGFKMTFDNGLTVSVQWGETNYCDNKCHTIEEVESTDFSRTHDASSNTAEVAIMYNNTFIKPSVILRNYHDRNANVLGWQTPNEVLDILNRVRQIDQKSVGQILLSNHIVTELNSK